MRHRSSGGAIPAFMIFDQTYRDRYPIGNLLPGRTPESAIESGFLARAASVEALCGEVGIDAAGLSATLARFNEMAMRGVDEDFQRGEFAFDRYGGDPTVAPNPCLAPIHRPPFYALRIYAGGPQRPRRCVDQRVCASAKWNGRTDSGPVRGRQLRRRPRWADSIPVPAAPSAPP